MRERNRGGSIFTRVAGHDFLVFNRSKRVGASPAGELARLKWTKELKTFSLLAGGWSGFNVKRLTGLFIPTSVNFSILNDRKPSRSQFFFKTLTWQFLLKRAMYFSAPVAWTGRYYLFKWIITLAVCGLFTSLACFTFFIILVSVTGASLCQLWIETLILDVNVGLAGLWIIEQYSYYLFLLSSGGYDTLGGIVDPASAWFRWTNVSFVFQDFELFFSFTDFFSNVLRSLVFLEITSGVWGYAMVFCCVTALTLVIFCCRVLVGRADFWVYFFNITYYSNWSTRMASFDYLSQILAGGVIADSKLLDRELLTFAIGGAFGVQSRPYTQQIIVYYFSQTVGGYSGFMDLFPSINSYVNEQRLGVKSLKTFKRFTLIKNYLYKKVSIAFPSLSEIKFLNFRSRIPVRTNLLAHTRPVSSYLGRYFPESYVSKFWLCTLDFFVGISRVGDLAAMFIRSRWFTSTVVRNYGFWLISFLPNLKKDSSVGGVFPEVPKVLWYRREVSTNEVRNRLGSLFRGSSFLRFKVGYHSLLNDFSFWRTDFNPEGEHEYFSFWDGFSEDNSHASSAFKSPKFSIFEPTSGLISSAGADTAINDDEDSSHPDFVDSYTETHFEDNFLQKDVSLVFFDDLLAEKVRQLRVMPDEDGLSYYQSEALEDVVSNEYLMYGAGQEGDLTATTTSAEYSSLYTKEYGGGLHYKESVVTGIYDDLADYWGLHSTMLVSRVTKIPAARLPFFGGLSFKKVRYSWDFRKRAGRVLYFYWNIFHTAMLTNYVGAWRLEVIYFCGFAGVISIFMGNALGLFLGSWVGIFAGVLFLGFTAAFYLSISSGLLEIYRGSLFGAFVEVFFLFKWFRFRGTNFESRVTLEKWLVGSEVTGFSPGTGLGSLAHSRDGTAMSAYSRFLTNANPSTSFFFVGVSTPTFVARKIFENAHFTGSLAYIYRILCVGTVDLFGLGGNLPANKGFGVVGNFYVSYALHTTKFLSALSVQKKFEDLSVSGDLSLGRVTLNGYGFELGGLTRDYLFEDYARLQWRGSLVSDVSGTPTPVSVFEKYYLRSFSSLEFYPTLSSKSVYWSLLWAKITFANTVWPQTVGRDSFGPLASLTSLAFNGPKANLGGQNLNMHTRNKQKFFNFFQHHGVYDTGGSAFAANFLRAFTFKWALARIFTLSYRRALTATAGGIYYRTHVRYMPYKTSLSRFVGD